MADFPFICLGQQFFFAEGDSALAGQTHYDIVEFLSIGLDIADHAAKSIGKRQFLFQSIGTMDVFIMLQIVAVTPCLLNQMTAVAGCVDQNVVRLGFYTAFDHGF